jgi:hypothetical protein
MPAAFIAAPRLAANVVGIQPVAVQRMNGGDLHAADGLAAAEAREHHVGRIAAVGP